MENIGGNERDTEIGVIVSPGSFRFHKIGQNVGSTHHIHERCCIAAH
jgi:hypothetical protein